MARYGLPFAYGLPILGIVYAAGGALALVLVAKLPDAGAALTALPPPVHWGAIPVGLAMWMLHWRPDGLKPHAALWAWIDAATTVRELTCWQAAESGYPTLALGENNCPPDGPEPRYRAGLVRGPARVLLRYPSRGWQRGRRLHVEQTSEEPLFVGTQVTLRDGEELIFEGGRG